MRVVRGAVFDVAVDIRKSSPSFGQWVGTELSDANRRQLWIPPGFAHGFLVLSESAEFLYKTTEYYAPDLERCIIWNDPRLAIDWPAGMDPQLSARTSRPAVCGGGIPDACGRAGKTDRPGVEPCPVRHGRECGRAVAGGAQLTPAACACSSAWYEDRTIAPTAACVKPIA